MEDGKKKYLEKNPNSRRLLFEPMVMQIESCTEAILMLMNAYKTRRGFLMLPYDRGLEDAALIQPLASMICPDLVEPSRYFAEYLIAWRLKLYGERNDWLESFPDLVDLAGLPPLAQYPIRAPEIVPNESTGP